MTAKTASIGSLTASALFDLVNIILDRNGTPTIRLSDGAGSKGCSADPETCPVVSFGSTHSYYLNAIHAITALIHMRRPVPIIR